MNWYALKSNDELVTAAFLRQANYPAYVPCETVERKLFRKRAPVRRPLYPGYVFVCCTEEAFTAVRAIGASEDFVRFTSPAGVRVPLRLPADALVGVFLAEAAGDFDHTRTPPPYAPARGDWVRITVGLWQGYCGAITSVGKRKLLLQSKWCRMEAPMGGVELAA